MHVVSGANLAFASSTHVCHASSPVHAEEKVDLCLKSGQRINTPTDQQAEAIEAARLDGLRVCRIKVASPAMSLSGFNVFFGVLRCQNLCISGQFCLP
jgi:hypothetical protein